MHRANVPEIVRYKLFKEAFKTASLLNALLIVEIDGEQRSRVEHWGGQKPKYAANLRTWGEAGTVKVKTNTTPKLADQGVQCMMVGYAKDHKGNVYRMWDPDTNGINKTRDVIWLRRMFYEKSKPTFEVAAPIKLMPTMTWRPELSMSGKEKTRTRMISLRLNKPMRKRKLRTLKLKATM
jgi:hypothetical protein